MPGVYISYPFCTQKCTFCNFASGVGSGAEQRDYATVLLDEIRGHTWEWEADTIYFGGGTPSLMPTPLVQEIFEVVPSRRLREITIECAPGSLDEKKLSDWVRLGINRVSLGVQSFVSKELRQTGRRHDAADVARDVGLLHQGGISNFNVDLIAGLPGQTLASWRESLDWIAHLQPPHVSVYLFEIDEDSRLGSEMLSGGARYGAASVPDEDLAAELYETAVARLSSLGIARYEISNFAMPGAESLHNLKYWTLQPYVGFGLDAASFDGKWRRNNPDTLAAYLAHANPDITPSEPASERFITGLRLSSGIQPAPEEWHQFAGPIEKWSRAGMLEINHGMLRFSDRGVLLSNEVLADFI